MRTVIILTGVRWVCALAVALLPVSLCAQDLAPRAYLITPRGSNALTLSLPMFKGGLDLNGAVPVQDATASYATPVLTYYRSFGVFGRSANVAVAVPYGVGSFEGTINGTLQRRTYRSGLLDSGMRFAINLKGGPAMNLPDFARWHQGTLLGFSLRIVVPLGQYHSDRLVNWGTHRWGFKPEFGLSRRWGNWILDGYSGVWLFTANDASFSLSTPKRQTLSPIGSFEGHLSYDVKPRLWFSLDGNFWTGATATVEGVENPLTKQISARVGGTASIPLNRRQSIKISYSRGAFSRFGGDYQNFTLGWQYAWLSRTRDHSDRQKAKPAPPESLM